MPWAPVKGRSWCPVRGQRWFLRGSVLVPGLVVPGQCKVRDGVSPPRVMYNPPSPFHLPHHLGGASSRIPAQGSAQGSS